MKMAKISTVTITIDEKKGPSIAVRSDVAVSKKTGDMIKCIPAVVGSCGEYLPVRFHCADDLKKNWILNEVAISPAACFEKGTNNDLDSLFVGNKSQICDPNKILLYFEHELPDDTSLEIQDMNGKELPGIEIKKSYRNNDIMLVHLEKSSDKTEELFKLVLKQNIAPTAYFSSYFILNGNGKVKGPLSYEDVRMLPFVIDPKK